MGAIGISEFTFGYAFLHEQTHANWNGLKAAPVLPSLQQEHEQGWDAHLPLVGTDFYYQFKLSEYLHRKNAKYIADNTYDGPYYRLSLHRKDGNRQHQRLKRHAEINPNTYYVAPEFNSVDEFNTAFLEREISNRSRLIPVAECDEIKDGDQHYITFASGSEAWYQHSQSKLHRQSYYGEELGSFYETTRPTWRRIDEGFSVELFERARSVVRESLEFEDTAARGSAIRLLDFDPRQRTRAEVLRRTSEILSVTLGVTLLLVGVAD
jgi:hypothetical protein